LIGSANDLTEMISRDLIFSSRLEIDYCASEQDKRLEFAKATSTSTLMRRFLHGKQTKSFAARLRTIKVELISMKRTLIVSINRTSPKEEKDFENRSDYFRMPRFTIRVAQFAVVNST